MSTKTVSAKSAYRGVLREAEKIKNDAHADVATLSPGDVVRQGDVYLIALDRVIPGGKPAATCQLAPGNTQGSRHIAEGDCEVLTVPERDAVAELNRLVPETRGNQQFIGPMVVARGGVTITHPEHGDRTLPPGTYLTTYQRAWAEEIRRQAD